MAPSRGTGVTHTEHAPSMHMRPVYSASLLRRRWQLGRRVYRRERRRDPAASFVRDGRVTLRKPNRSKFGFVKTNDDDNDRNDTL